MSKAAQAAHREAVEISQSRPHQPFAAHVGGRASGGLCDARELTKRIIWPTNP
ncbi:MAG: hypothetical protein U0401_35325 [Anaerolineae bacterium]